MQFMRGNQGTVRFSDLPKRTQLIGVNRDLSLGYLVPMFSSLTLRDCCPLRTLTLKMGFVPMRALLMFP